MSKIIFLAVMLSVSYGQRFQPGYANKPILRMGPDPMDLYVPQRTTEAPVEPRWVSLLRSKLETAVRYQGLDNAKESIKDMINGADLEINGYRQPRVSETASALRTLTNGMYSNDDESNTDAMYAPSLRSKWEPRWEKDLKTYIKGLIGQYGKSHLDDFVRPIVTSIESSNKVRIKDIDVNPYGEVSVNWKPTDLALRARYDRLE